MSEERSRGRYVGEALLVGALGLATRPLKGVFDALGSAVGDALWAVLVYLLIVIVFPRMRPAAALVVATLVAWAVEVSQLWHVGWLKALP